MAGVCDTVGAGAEAVAEAEAVAVAEPVARAPPSLSILNACPSLTS